MLYDFRSGMGTQAVFALNFFASADPSVDAAVEQIASLRKYQPLFTGDYYPLSPYSTSKDAWVAWQFYRPDLQAGIVQAFRRQTCPENSFVCKLPGLDPAGQYLISNADEFTETTSSGRDLLEKGFTVSAPTQPYAAVITYRRIK